MPIKVEDMSGGSRLPERIGRLEELANNLWWSWYPQARDLFRALDYPLWRLGGHNPVKQLREISTDKLEEAASAPVFLSLYDSVMSAFDAGISAKDSWFATKYPNVLDGPVAYFSAEKRRGLVQFMKIGGRERNVWQVGIAYQFLVLNSAYQAGVIVLALVVLLPASLKALP